MNDNHTAKIERAAMALEKCLDSKYPAAAIAALELATRQSLEALQGLRRERAFGQSQNGYEESFEEVSDSIGVAHGISFDVLARKLDDGSREYVLRGHINANDGGQSGVFYAKSDVAPNSDLANLMLLNAGAFQFMPALGHRWGLNVENDGDHDWYDYHSAEIRDCALDDMLVKGCIGEESIITFSQIDYNDDQIDDSEVEIDRDKWAMRRGIVIPEREASESAPGSAPMREKS